MNVWIEKGRRAYYVKCLHSLHKKDLIPKYFLIVFINKEGRKNKNNCTIFRFSKLRDLDTDGIDELRFGNWILRLLYSQRFKPIEMVLSKSGSSKMKRANQLLLLSVQIILTTKNHISYFTIRRSCKGQLISKCPFGVFNSSKKTKEKIQLTVSTLIP